VTDREARTRAVKLLARSIYRDLEAQGFDEKQIVSLATELISEVTTRIARVGAKPQLAWRGQPKQQCRLGFSGQGSPIAPRDADAPGEVIRCARTRPPVLRVLEHRLRVA